MWDSCETEMGVATAVFIGEEADKILNPGLEK